jgi:ABC-type transport system involved in multi-copper enzyme maturation permease subunit
MIAGAILLVTGALWHFAPWSLNWFGKLPGDIRIETESGKIFIPLASMIIVSVVLSLLLSFFRR